jgi:DNA-binding NarL/FixJ family response regulator
MELATDFARGWPETFVLAIAAGHDVFGAGVCDDRDVLPSVLIVDDHAEFREAASALLEAEGFTVVGSAADGDAAIAAAKRLRPQVVLLDVQLPGLDGFGVAELLACTFEPPAVVLISSREAVAYGRRLETAPVRGFIPKRALSGAALAALVG